MIEMRIRRMQVGVLRNSRCEGAYVQFFNEPAEDVDETSLSKGGRYCGHVTGNTTRLLSFSKIKWVTKFSNTYYKVVSICKNLD